MNKDLKADLELCQKLGCTIKNGVSGRFVSDVMKIGGKPSR